MRVSSDAARFRKDVASVSAKSVIHAPLITFLVNLIVYLNAAVMLGEKLPYIRERNSETAPRFMSSCYLQTAYSLHLFDLQRPNPLPHPHPHHRERQSFELIATIGVFA